MFLTDGYKMDHRRQYPEGTEFVYSNWTARSGRHFHLPEGRSLDGYVVFGVQYLCLKYFIEHFNKNFFLREEHEVVKEFHDFLGKYMGIDFANKIGVDHIRDLHRLQYLPIEVKALEEGTICPIGVPSMTIINTNPRFYWITNYLETLISNTLWMSMTSATTAREFKKELKRHCEKTGIKMNDFLMHDFSMRGLPGESGTILSGMGHLTSFTGSESIPAIVEMENYYPVLEEGYVIAATIPATEHSVACAGSDYSIPDPSDKEYLKRMLDLYPNGYVSIVADTFDFWRFISKYIPECKEQIVDREGRLVVRPDSGVPEDIIAGKPHLEQVCYEEGLGAYEILYNTFGGKTNKNGYVELNDHIGMIYGDSINLERQSEIYKRLEDKGMSASNLVLGIGSYTYQGVTKDSLGFAMKATWAQIEGERKEMYKNPKTVIGMPKKSLKGLIRVVKNEDGKLKALDQQEHDQDSLLQTVFKNGEMIKFTDLKKIRENINSRL